MLATTIDLLSFLFLPVLVTLLFCVGGMLLMAAVCTYGVKPFHA